jgi:hypothetical protein
MAGANEVKGDIEAFLGEWSGPDEAMRDCARRLFQAVFSLVDVVTSFVARPGISYSLRPKHIRQSRRPLFAIVDVIDDDPAERWLSVCFYGDMISDPEDRGELVPGGLAGEDGYCFDLFAADPVLLAYLQERLAEAWRSAQLEDAV